MSLPAGVERSRPSFSADKVDSLLLEVCKQTGQSLGRPAQTVDTPTHNGRHLAGCNVRFQGFPARSVHRLARELILVPSDGLVLCVGPPLKVGQLGSNILPVAFRLHGSRWRRVALVL